ncbi:MAG: ribose 5-phosphate isomerase B [Myxococcota bacterium]
MPLDPSNYAIVVASDHAGLALKEELIQPLGEFAKVVDLGTHDSESCDYPQFAHAVARHVLEVDGTYGVLVCGTGVGMSIAANRHRGVRAVVCSDEFSAAMARRHNDANVLCLGARVVGFSLATSLCRAFLTTPFEGGRHQRRVDQIEPA